MADDIIIVEPSMEELLLSYKVMEAELIETKEKLEEARNSIEKEYERSLELKELFATSIDKKWFSARVFNIFSRAGINTVFDLIQYSRVDFLKHRDSGEKSADEVETFLKSKGLFWKVQIETLYRVL